MIDAEANLTFTKFALDHLKVILKNQLVCGSLDTTYFSDLYPPKINSYIENQKIWLENLPFTGLLCQ